MTSAALTRDLVRAHCGAVIRVLLVDDQSLFLDGLRMVLSVEEGIVVVGEAKDGASAISMVESARPHVVLMDLRMPGMDGIEAIKRISARFPRVGIIALTTFDDDVSIFRALRGGAVGYLVKDSARDVLVAAIRAASKGDSVLAPHVARRLVDELARLSTRPPDGQEHSLSERELDVVRLLARGSSNKEIANALGLVEGTVKNHVSRILEKLGVIDRTQAALAARDAGIV
jgi:DNA-binding NarL/FixJ family response regulator